ncbi:MAG: hypothetical protein EGR89_00180 [[Eubacterium] rectale]|nr:hypothetical protein [Agathobacter rectalis]
MASRRELLMKANQANSSRIKLQKDQETIVDAIVNELEDDSDKEKTVDPKSSSIEPETTTEDKKELSDKFSTDTSLTDANLTDTSLTEENIIAEDPDTSTSAEKKENHEEKLVESEVNVTSAPPIHDSQPIIENATSAKFSGNSEQKETSYTENITESAKIETNTYVPQHQEVASINNENTKSSVNLVTEGNIERKKRPSLRATEKKLKDRKLSVLLTEAAYANVERFTQELGYRSKNDFLNTLFERLDDIIE